MGSVLAWLATQFVTLLLRLYFRDTDSFNTHKIPKDAGVIFVCGPHANQVCAAPLRRPCPRSDSRCARRPGPAVAERCHGSFWIQCS